MAGYPGFTETLPHPVFAELSTSCASAGAALMQKRSRALAEYWQAVGMIREAAELFALNLGYCSQLLDDYAAAYAEGLRPVTAPIEPASETAAPAFAETAAQAA